MMSKRQSKGVQSRCVRERFAGHLSEGEHQPDHKACVLEAYSAAQGMAWTDDPETLRIWDLRPLNDIRIDGALRVEHLAPVLVAYQGSRDWLKAEQVRVLSRLGILLINRVISGLPGLPLDLREKCRRATTLDAARGAAEASWAASWAAEAAAKAAKAAEWAAKAAGVTAAEWAAKAETAEAAAMAEKSKEARTQVFILACRIFLDAAQEAECT